VATLDLQNQAGFGLDGHLVTTVETPKQPIFKGFGPAGLSALMEAARHDTASLRMLTKANLSLNRIGDEGMGHLAAALAAGAFPSIVQILLYRNEFGNDGIQALARGLAAKEQCPALRDIYLGLTPVKIASISEETRAAVAAAGCKATIKDGVMANTEGCAVHFAATGPGFKYTMEQSYLGVVGAGMGSTMQQQNNAVLHTVG